VQAAIVVAICAATFGGTVILWSSQLLHFALQMLYYPRVVAAAALISFGALALQSWRPRRRGDRTADHDPAPAGSALVQGLAEP
jgi:protein-S-isoprenylcysteine O-methyltransferase Ste14